MNKSILIAAGAAALYFASRPKVKITNKGILAVPNSSTGNGIVWQYKTRLKGVNIEGEFYISYPLPTERIGSRQLDIFAKNGLLFEVYIIDYIDAKTGDLILVLDFLVEEELARRATINVTKEAAKISSSIGYITENRNLAASLCNNGKYSTSATRGACKDNGGIKTRYMEESDRGKVIPMDGKMYLYKGMGKANKKPAAHLEIWTGRGWKDVKNTNIRMKMANKIIGQKTLF